MATGSPPVRPPPLKGSDAFNSRPGPPSDSDAMNDRSRPPANPCRKRMQRLEIVRRTRWPLREIGHSHSCWAQKAPKKGSDAISSRHRRHPTPARSSKPVSVLELIGDVRLHRSSDVLRGNPRFGPLVQAGGVSTRRERSHRASPEHSRLHRSHPDPCPRVAVVRESEPPLRADSPHTLR
jgi:hypothetical protein